MQIKEVCQRTALSRKTIRYYEEEGLIHPEKELRNGRAFRTYTEADIQQLMTIASLRRAWFTIEEIRTMQQQPETIAEIVPRYLQWLQAQQQTLRGLISAAQQLRPDSIESISQLSRLLSHESGKLPLPQADLEPHFKYLDALEEPPQPDPPTAKMDKALPGDRTGRHSVAAISRSRADNYLALNDQLNDTFGYFAPENKGVSDRDELKLSKKQAALRRVLDYLLVLLCVLTVIAYMNYLPAMPFLLAILALGSWRGVLGYLDHRAKVRQWTSRSGHPSDFSVDRKKVLLIFLAGILCIAVFVGGVSALVLWKTPREVLDGPMIENPEEMDMREYFLHFPFDQFGEFNEYMDLPPYLLTDRRVYFLRFGALYSANTDYTNMVKIDEGMVCAKGARSELNVSTEKPSVAACFDGFIYYISMEPQRFPRKGYRYFLARYRCGSNETPEQLFFEGVDHNSAVGLSGEGEIICYGREHGRWFELTRYVPAS